MSSDGVVTLRFVPRKRARRFAACVNGSNPADIGVNADCRELRRWSEK